MSKLKAMVLAMFFLPVVAVLAQEEKHEFSLTLENDKFLAVDHTDRHYTHGTILSYWDAEGEVPLLGKFWEPQVLEVIPSLGLKIETNRFGFTLAQKIFTPARLSTTALITNDRPYAGWLYGGVLMQRRGESFSLPTRDIFELDLGMVGPSAYAENTQNFVHRIINVGEAKGWTNQLRDEFAFDLQLERDFLISSRSKDSLLGWELIPKVGADLGAVQVSANLGLEMRAGFNLPNDFGAFETKSWGLYAFGGVDGRAVAHNIFLDGNTFRSSHHVDKLPLVADFRVGVAWKACSNFELSYTYVYRTREFHLQTEDDRFGSITCRFMF